MQAGISKNEVMNYNRVFFGIKNKFIITIIIFLCVILNTLAQSGTYIREPKSVDSTKIKWALSLNIDGTFLYHFFRDISGEANSEENFYGKGTWESTGQLIYFYSESSSLSDEFTINLNNSKAKIKSKSPRDKSDKIIKSSLRFYESESIAIKGLELFKQKN